MTNKSKDRRNEQTIIISPKDLRELRLLRDRSKHVVEKLDRLFYL